MNNKLKKSPQKGTKYQILQERIFRNIKFYKKSAPSKADLLRAHIWKFVAIPSYKHIITQKK